MINRINQIVHLKNNESYLIVKQAVYNNENYFFCDRIVNDNLSHEFELFREFQKDAQVFLEKVDNLDVAQAIFKALKLV